MNNRLSMVVVDIFVREMEKKSEDDWQAESFRLRAHLAKNEPDLVVDDFQLLSPLTVVTCHSKDMTRDMTDKIWALVKQTTKDQPNLVEVKGVNLIEPVSFPGCDGGCSSLAKCTADDNIGYARWNPAFHAAHFMSWCDMQKAGAVRAENAVQVITIRRLTTVYDVILCKSTATLSYAGTSLEWRQNAASFSFHISL